MEKAKQIVMLPMEVLETNNGQLDGLPANPRTISEDKFRKLKRDIDKYPELLEYRSLLVYPLGGGYIIIGGNMRYRAMRELGHTAAPCIVIDAAATAEQLKAYTILDNNGFGQWDWDMLANEWAAEDLDEWGLDLWQDIAEDTQADDEAAEENNKEDDIFSMMLSDRIYESDNEFDIPLLKLEGQPQGGLLLPFSGWGTETRQKKGIATYHFYVDDYRFTGIWKDPASVLCSGCTDIVEPNLSLFDTTPIAYGVQLIYMKRWVARFWQECGAKVYADLNVARKFQKYNILGIPKGYNAFATRGYSDREEYLKEEIQIAREISGKQTPSMIVYGGGENIKRICMEQNVLYVEQYIRNKIKRGKKSDG